MTTGLAGTLPKLLLVATGNICIWRGLRSALADLWGGLTGKSVRENTGRSRFADEAQPVSDFDADEAFARYMAQRKAREEEPEPDSGRRATAPRPATRSPYRSKEASGARPSSGA